MLGRPGSAHGLMQAALLAAPTLIARAAGCEWRLIDDMTMRITSWDTGEEWCRVAASSNMAVGRYTSASRTYITGHGHTNLIVLERLGKLTKGCTCPTLRRHAV